MNEDRFTHLLDQYVTGSIQEPEQREFFALLEDPAYRTLLENRLELEWQEGQYEEKENGKMGLLIEQYVLNRISNEKPVVTIPRARVVNWWRRMAVAAAVLVVLAGATYYMLTSTTSEPQQVVINMGKTDAVPGGNKAVLTLGDGRQVVLDSLQNGIIAQQGSVDINKPESGKLMYSRDSKETQTVFNTVSTPRGGQYQVQLPDGTWVWLNAASSLRFPTAFKGKERVVEITGEAYFEVASLPLTPSGGGGIKGKVPFIVEVAGKGRVEVLGTHFNINSYDDEASIKTSLIEGSVRVGSLESVVGRKQPDGNARTSDLGPPTSVVLKPGQQAQMDNGQLKVVNDIDMEEILAWKLGLFRFNNADIETVMKQVERWYDVEVVYEGPKPDGHYRGKVPRNVMASEMLRIIEASGVKCRIENKKIIIMK
jgi:transmembrane sensor